MGPVLLDAPIADLGVRALGELWVAEHGASSGASIAILFDFLAEGMLVGHLRDFWEKSTVTFGFRLDNL